MRPVHHTKKSPPGDAFDGVLREELDVTSLAYCDDGRMPRALSFTRYKIALRTVREVQLLRQAFALARRRAERRPPEPVDVLDAATEIRTARELSTVPAAASVHPRFGAAEAWCVANPRMAPEVDQQLAELTRDWAPSLQGDRERLRPIARLLVFHRHTRGEARSA